MPLPVRRRDRSPQRAQRREPFRELEQLQDATAQLLEMVWSGGGPAAAGVRIPLVEIEETDDAWIVEAELPGLDGKDVSVEARESELVITARPQRIEVREGPR